MSEKYPGNPNHEELGHSHEENPGQSHENLEVTPENQEKPKDIEQIRHSIESHAKDSEKLRRESAPEQEQRRDQPFINRELKEMAYRRLLLRARRHFNAYDKMVSRVIHQPALDAVSEVASRTVARPSGILGGGLTALVGTTIYYLVAKHYGYSYNFLVFIILIFIGFLLGWSVELLWRFIKRPKRS
jgi:hypothetical protein